MRRVKASAEMPGAAGGAAVRGASNRLGAGVTSYARRLILSRCLGEMLSEVMFPPYPPHPRVIAGSSPVVRPIDPCVVGELTTIRNAGFFNPNSRMTCSFCEWIDIVWPIPPYRRICLQRSHPSRQSATTYRDKTGHSFSIDNG